jgi:hypothetical protein
MENNNNKVTITTPAYICAGIQIFCLLSMIVFALLWQYTNNHSLQDLYGTFLTILLATFFVSGFTMSYFINKAN